MVGPELERLIALLGRLPGLGPRSARRAALHLLKRREALMLPLADALAQAATAVRPCGVCNAWDERDPCAICADPARDRTAMCVVAEVGDLWALERSGGWRGVYHVLGGLLSAIDGRDADAIGVDRLAARVRAEPVREVVLALSATVEGQTTADVVADALAGGDVAVSRLAQGVPFGGELDHLDDGTLIAAMRARRANS
ncbi:MAG: recombination mediator RecR [Pseudomonadota bacterium]